MQIKGSRRADVRNGVEPSRCLQAAYGQSLELQPATMSPLHIGGCQGADIQQCCREELKCYTTKCQINMAAELRTSVSS